MSVIVRYSDGTTATYASVSEAQEEIEETITGCNFAVLPESITLEGKTLGCLWTLKLYEV